jgi:hypothetical protein
MPSDERRVHQAYRHIQRIKAGDYPVIVGRDDRYRVEDRPWKDMPEASKLAILQDAVDWSGITNRDQAHILLAEIDPGRITDAQRNRLIDAAGVLEGLRETLKERAAAGAGATRDHDLER